MSVYKVLVQKFDLGKEEPFQTECIEVCADAFFVDKQGILLFKNTNPYENIGAIPCGTWYRVQEVEKGCECGCDEQARIPTSSTSTEQGKTETPI